MTRYLVTVVKDSKIAVVRTLQAHGQGPANPSLFAGADRQVIQLA